MVGDELTVGGRQICAEYNMILASYTDTPPQPKVEKIEIPYGTDLDVTDSLGGVAFTNRTQQFTCLMKGETEQDFMDGMTALKMWLDGQYFDYTMSFDYGWYYRGRWSVLNRDDTTKGFHKVTFQVDGYPYKYKMDENTDTFNASPKVSKSYILNTTNATPRLTTTNDHTCEVTFEGNTGQYHGTEVTIGVWAPPIIGENKVTFEIIDPAYWLEDAEDPTEGYDGDSALFIDEKFVELSYDAATETLYIDDTHLYDEKDECLYLEDVDEYQVTLEYLGFNENAEKTL